MTDDVFRLSRGGVESLPDAERLLREMLAAVATPAELGKEYAQLRDHLKTIDADYESRGKSVPALLGTIDGSPLINAAVARLLAVMRDYGPPHEVTELNRIAKIASRRRPQTTGPVVIAGTLIETLLALGHNRMHLSTLADESGPSYAPVFFVGAGMSVASKFPMWSEYLRSLAGPACVAPQVEAYLEAGRFEEAAEHVEKAVGRVFFNLKLVKTFGREPDVKGAITMLPGLTRGPVVTTNYDRVVEKVFAAEDRALQVFSGARLTGFDGATRRSKPYLLKIHGDVEAIDDRILTLSEYQQHYGSIDMASADFSLPLPRAMFDLLSFRTAVFLGCSLKNDRTVQLLEYISSSSRGAFGPRHYAICEAPGDDVFERHNELSRLGILTIFYRHGKHEDIEALLEEIGMRWNIEPAVAEDVVRILRAALELLKKPHAIAHMIEERVLRLTKKWRVPLVSVRGADAIQSDIDALTQAIDEAHRVLDQAREKLADDRSLIAAIDRYHKASTLLLRARDSAVKGGNEQARQSRRSWYGEALHAADEVQRSINMLLHPRR